LWPDTIRARGSTARFCDAPLIVLGERPNLRISKRICFSPGSKYHLTAVGVSNSPNTQPIDLPNSNGDKCCAAQWHAMTDQTATTSGETSRTDFARSFGSKSKLF
jgi:hypothetical protein